MRDRAPTKVLDNGAIRYGVYDEAGVLLRYEYIRPEDEPAQTGTPLTKATLLSDDTALAIGLDGEDPTVNEALARLAARGAMKLLPVTLPSSGWETDENLDEKYPRYIDVAHDEIAEDMVPILTILPSSLATAGASGLRPVAETRDKALRVHAKKVPEVPISASLTLVKIGSGGGGALSPATRDSLGPVKVGGGLKIAPDGTLSVDVATPEELEELFAQEPQDQDSSDG